MEKALAGDRLTRADSLALVGATSREHPALWAAAAHMRDLTRPPIVTYSRKVFIPLTNLCRDVCSYCTFAVDEDSPRAKTLTPDEVRAMAEQARDLGCKEALFCIGDRPEVRWPKYRDILRGFGHESTQSYLVAMCRMVMEEYDLLPHPNAGIMSERELRAIAQDGPLTYEEFRTLHALIGGLGYATLDRVGTATLFDLLRITQADMILHGVIAVTLAICGKMNTASQQVIWD